MCFTANETLAVAVNQLLVVGFYLLNRGFVAIFLRASHATHGSGRLALEELSTKVGTVSVVLGLVHFTNVWTFNIYRNRALDRPALAIAPVNPTGSTVVANPVY